MIRFKKIFSTTEGKILTKKQNELYKIYSELPINDPSRKQIEFEMQVLSDNIASLNKTNTLNGDKNKMVKKHAKDYGTNVKANKKSKQIKAQRKSFIRKISGSILFVIGIFIFVYFIIDFTNTYRKRHYFDELRNGIALGVMLISTGLILMFWDNMNNQSKKKEN